MKKRPVLSFWMAAIVGTAAVLAVGPSGSSAATTVSQSTGDFLTGSVATIDLGTLVDLQGATAVNTGSPATVQDAHPLDVTAVSALNVPLGGGLQLLGGLNPILDLGAANQYAIAKNDGSSYGASGAVTDQGAVAVGGPNPGPQGSTSLNLTPLLSGLGLTTVLSNTSLSIGALAATADQPAPGTSPAPTGTYRIAGVTLDLTSPLVGSTLGPILNALVTTACTTPPCLVQLTAPGVVIDLTTGQITLDVSALLPNLDGALPPNSPVLPALISAVTTALTSVQLEVNGTVVPLGLLTGPLGTALNTIVGQLSTALTTLLTLTANVQTPTPPAAGQKFTETALSVALVPGAGPLALVNLASASVGPNAGPALPASTSLNPSQGPTTGGQTVTITGANFIPGATTVTIGGVTIPANQVTVSPDATTLTFVTPAHAAGTVPVTVTTAGGTSAPLSYTYVPAPTSGTLSPTSGPASGGQTVTMTGTGFVPGATTVTIGGITIPANQVTVSADGTSLTFVTPAHAVGTVNVTATTPGGTSAALQYTYVPTAPTITSPTDGSLVGTGTTISGTGTPGDTVTVSEGGTTICTATVGSSGTWSCTPSTPLSEGTHTITATETAPGGQTSAPSSPVTFTVVGAPTTSSLSPTQGPQTGGTTVTITGTNFVPGQTTVTIGGITIPASQVSVSADGTTLTFVTPAHAPGAVDVVVTTPGGASAALTFTYQPAAPTITSPADGSSSGPQPTITGTGIPGSSVTVTDANGNVVCTAIVDANGNWSCTPTSALSGGSNTLTATQTTPDGLTSPPSAPIHITVNTLAATGATPQVQTLLGLLVVLLGGGLVAWSRRRAAAAV